MIKTGPQTTQATSDVCLAIEEGVKNVERALYGTTEPREALGNADDQALKREEQVDALAKTGTLEQATLNKNIQTGLTHRVSPVSWPVEDDRKPRNAANTY